MEHVQSLKNLTITGESGKVPIMTYLKNKLSETFSFENKNVAYDSFEKNLMTVKAILVIMLMVMAIYYPLKFKTTGIIGQKPLLMLAESVVLAMSAIVPFIMLVLLRNKKYALKDIIKYGILIFIVFFVLNYLLELSGFYEYTFASPKPSIKAAAEQQYTETEKFVHTLDISLRSIFLLVAVVIFIILFLAVFFVRDTNIDYNFKGVNKWIIFFFETLLFGAISAVPIYFIAKNRKDLDPTKTSEEFLIVTAKFMLINIFLQFSGFYNHFFIKNYEY